MLTPDKRAEWDYKTQVGVAEQLSKMKWPSMMVIGGNNGSATNPFDAVGLKSLIDIQKQLSRDDDK